VGPQLLIFGSKNEELLEMNSLLPPHSYLESWQTTNFAEKILKTIGDMLGQK